MKKLSLAVLTGLIAMTVVAFGGGTVITQPVSIPANAITNAKLRDSVGLSVIGRASNSSGDPADIAAASDGQVLRRSGTEIGFGDVPQSSVTGLSTSLTGKAATTTTIDTTAPLTGGGDLSANRTFAIAANGIDNTLIRDSAALSVIGRATNSSGDPADIAAGTDGDVLRRSGTALAFGPPANDFAGAFGSGYHGDLVFDGTSTVAGIVPAAGVYTLTGGIYAKSITCNGTFVRVITNGNPVFADGTVGAGCLFSWNGNNASGQTAGAALTSGTLVGGQAGANGGNTVGLGGSAVSVARALPWCSQAAVAAGTSDNGVALTNYGKVGTACHGGTGGAVAGTAGGGASNAFTALLAASDLFPTPLFYLSRVWYDPVGSSAGPLATGGGGGGAGGSAGVGGGGGGGAGWVTIKARNCGAGAWTVESKGGAGANGVGGSGGGGGAGGNILVYCGAGTLPTTNNTPGARGASHNGNLLGTGAGSTYPGGCGGAGRKMLYSPSTGWTHTADSPVGPC